MLLAQGDAEVHQLDLSFARDHDVARRQVAVDDAFAVGVRQSVQNFGHEKRGALGPHDGLGGHERFLDRAQGRAVDVLHGDEVDLIDHAQFVDRDDIAVAQRHQDLGLGHEHVDELAVAGQLGMDLLDDERLLESSRTDELGRVDLGHTASGDLVGQEVLAEGGRQQLHADRA